MLGDYEGIARGDGRFEVPTECLARKNGRRRVVGKKEWERASYPYSSLIAYQVLDEKLTWNRFYDY